MEELRYTVKQAARELQVSPRTVRRWIDSGRLTGQKVVRGNLGMEWRISADSVRRVSADSRGHSSTATARGQPTDMTAELLEEVRSLREEGAAYREHLERMTMEIARLREQVQRLLPPAQEEHRPWWRLWGKGERP